MHACACVCVCVHYSQIQRICLTSDHPEISLGQVLVTCRVGDKSALFRLYPLRSHWERQKWRTLHPFYHSSLVASICQNEYTKHCLISTGRQAVRQTGRQAGRQTVRQTGRQTVRQTGRQAGSQTDMLVDKTRRQVVHLPDTVIHFYDASVPAAVPNRDLIQIYRHQVVVWQNIGFIV